METIEFISQKHGRKSRRATYCTIGGISFAVVPCNSPRVVYFGMPGNEWIEVYQAAWDGDDEMLPAVIEGAAAHISKLHPKKWVYDFSDITLKAIRNKELKPHKDYILALLDDYETYQGKKWKPNE